MQRFDTITLVGNLGSDPEIRTGDRGNYGRFSVAQTERKFNAESRSWEDGSQIWWSVKVNGALADLAQSHLHKGSGVMVYGQLAIQRWKDKNTGQDREQIVVNAIDIGLHLRNSGGQGGGQQGFGTAAAGAPVQGGFPAGQNPASNAAWGAPATSGPAPAAQPATEPWATGGSTYGDETPF